LKEHGDEMSEVRTEQTAGWAAELIAALMPAVARMDLARAVQLEGSMEGVADRMLSAIPDLYIPDPPVGAAYSTAALAQWKQISRQAVFAQRKAGRVFAAKHLGKLVFPSCQFDSVGDQLPRFRELLAAAKLETANLADFAEWLVTPDVGLGRTPADELGASADSGALHRPLPRKSELTVIDPPTVLDTGSTERHR
jgi:hypothetical protein